MPAPTPPPVEPDDRFPSGPWEGYFLDRRVGSQRFPMELRLTFRDGRVTGDGRDGVGPFTITGRYETTDGKASWTKRYPLHAVSYQGFAERKGIWGLWELPPTDRDGFHIWPQGHGAGEGQSEQREASPPVTFEDDALTAEPLVTAPA